MMIEDACMNALFISPKTPRDEWIVSPTDIGQAMRLVLSIVDSQYWYGLELTMALGSR